MKIFLDIGAHTGETLQVVSQAKWGFERIVCFEPASSCWPKLHQLADGRTEICEYGLWCEDAIIELNNAGEIGASVSPDKDVSTSAEHCNFRDAADWFSENISIDDIVFVKVNVEGAEVELIDRLAAQGQLNKIDQLLIHFDVRKVPSKAHQEFPTRAHLHAAGVSFKPADEIQFGGVYRGTANWLNWCHSTSRLKDVRYVQLPAVILPIRKLLHPIKRRLMSTVSSHSR